MHQCANSVREYKFISINIYISKNYIHILKNKIDLYNARSMKSKREKKSVPIHTHYFFLPLLNAEKQKR